jgi:hypothetical protein
MTTPPSTVSLMFALMKYCFTSPDDLNKISGMFFWSLTSPFANSVDPFQVKSAEPPKAPELLY